MDLTDPRPSAATVAAPPRVWVVLGDKLGDNAQVLALADALGWPYEIRQVFPRPEWVFGKPRFLPGLHHLDPERSDALAPPWPDILLTIGRRPAMAAMWVQERSEGRTRLVLVGRPKRWIERFALVVVPGQFQVPARGNVVHLALPLMRADGQAVAAGVEAWRGRLGGLQRPLTAVLVGGETKPFRLDGSVARDLAERLRALGTGTLFVTTSRRTRPEVADALAEGLPPGAVLYRWSPEAPDDNPYQGLLGLADRFVVTGDSVSMMVEVASLARPLAIFPLPLAPGLGNRLRAGVAGLLSRRGRGGGGGLLGGLAHLAHRTGAAGYARDLTAVHRLLYERGLAVPLGRPFRRPPAGGLADELAPVVARLRALAGDRGRD